VTDALDRAMAQAIKALNHWPARTAQLFHHNDADGLSSGAILTRALTRTGYGVERCCLEKPYPPVLEKIFQSQGALLIFADFASRIASLLSRYNQGRNLILILDHHPAPAVKAPHIHNLNPELFGFRGDRDVSAATTCYRFAQCIDVNNRDLAYLAVTGAVGDSFHSDSRLIGLNRLAAEDAVALGQLEIRSLNKGEGYRLRGPVHSCMASELAADLDVLGGAGFFQGGPEAGIQVCLEGFDDQARFLCGNLAAQKEAIYDAELQHLQSGTLQSTGQVQWFEVARRFNGIGVKMIGDFCRTIRDRSFMDPNRYIAGFQPVPDTVPGLGRIGFNAVKVSMRVPAALEARIISGDMPGLDQLLPDATHAVGGFSDACHSLAAATTIPPGKEMELVQTINSLLQAWITKRE
jgi:single-stranded-DNA-specific exonuclease